MRRIGSFFMVASLGTLASLGCKRHPTPSSGGAPSATVAPLPLPSAANVFSKEALRPAKPKTVANAPPPKLPVLHAQLATVQPPKKGKKGGTLADYPCGSVWTGEEEVALECSDPIDQTKFGSPAVALIPYELLHTPRADLPSTVDHRTDGFEGKVRAQGRVSACTAFSFASQIDHSLGLWTGQPGNVSVMQLWARYHVTSSIQAVAGSIGKSIASESDWPYDVPTAASWQTCKAGTGTSCLNAEEQTKLAGLDKKGIAVLEEVEWLPPNDALFDAMEAKLAAGRDIGTGGPLPLPFHPVGDAGSKYVPDPKDKPVKNGHAFSLVGYTHVENERYFLIKNSWGEKWGDGGYSWIHEATLRKMVRNAYVVVIDPIGVASSRRTRHGLVPACPAGEVPDSVLGTCHQVCPDGGPRHQNACAVASDCSKGHVNLAGECVLAAPRAKGTEPKTKIDYTCAPSGCVYNMVKGVEGCTDAHCQKSCPAPDYRLGKGKGGLLCLE